MELNFEKRPDFESLFTSNDPKEIIAYIGASHGVIDPSNTILFLDEIQVVPHLLSKLRWFAEEMEELPVIAAGSLLDLALADHEFSMPVGRISYMYLEPLSFEEFLEGTGRQELRKFLQDYQLKEKIPETIHKELTATLKDYLIVGGMPAAVSSWDRDKNLQTINQIHFDLYPSYFKSWLFPSSASRSLIPSASLLSLG